MLIRILMLAIGVFACSTAVIMLKASEIAPAQLASYRLLVAGVVLTPLLIRDWRRHRPKITRRRVATVLISGVLLGVHFYGWILGARLTLAANASLIVNMVPVVLPFFLFLLVRERLNLGEGLGTLLAIGGAITLTLHDRELGGGRFDGDLICLASMVFFAAYLAIGRASRHWESIWLYLVPVYLVGGAAAWVLSLPIEGLAPAAWSPREALLVLGLAVVPTIVGHGLLNVSMRAIRGQVVGIANLGQAIFAGVMAWLLMDEVPAWAFYVAGAMIGGGVYCSLRFAPRRAELLPEPLPDLADQAGPPALSRKR